MIQFFAPVYKHIQRLCVNMCMYSFFAFDAQPASQNKRPRLLSLAPFPAQQRLRHVLVPSQGRSWQFVPPHQALDFEAKCRNMKVSKIIH